MYSVEVDSIVLSGIVSLFWSTTIEYPFNPLVTVVVFTSELTVLPVAFSFAST